MAVARVHDVAAALLAETGSVTTMKLQKLVYYSQAWHLVFHGEPLFGDAIEAWPQGPVTRSLYDKHRRQRQVSAWPAGDGSKLTATERDTLRWVLNKYGAFSAESLSQMTHMEAPWRIARGVLGSNEHSSTPIDRQQMKHFYARQRAAVDVAVSQAAASAAIEGVELDDEWQETLRSVASGSVSADDAVAEEIRRAARS
ncbi:Panacea domain-containing protein [Amycolatopsis sp. cmx-11-51]|uniref:Panacea domain-containing protein n=1 Tax=Amycolatopsis sp. cmx-11-51 TaxID=2785797 RepID=UPI0039E5A7BC